MLYTVKHGDTLYRIAKRFGSSINSILKANIICDPDVIYVGDILIIPRQETNQPRAGGGPYYVVRPGDTLCSLSKELNIPLKVLLANNQLPNAELILYGSELLIWPDNIPEPYDLAAQWERLGDTPPEAIPGSALHEQLNLGTFQWAALGRQGIPFLLNFLNSPRDIIRLYAITALGRLGTNYETKLALEKMQSDNSRSAAHEAGMALTRINLAQQYGNRVHVVTRTQTLIGDLNTNAHVKELSPGTAIFVLRWHVPSPRGEYGTKGWLRIYDYVQVLETGEKGFLPRFGSYQIGFI